MAQLLEGGREGGGGASTEADAGGVSEGRGGEQHDVCICVMSLWKGGWCREPPGLVASWTVALSWREREREAVLKGVL